MLSTVGLSTLRDLRLEDRDPENALPSRSRSVEERRLMGLSAVLDDDGRNLPLPHDPLDVDDVVGLVVRLPGRRHEAGREGDSQVRRTDARERER